MIRHRAVVTDVAQGTPEWLALRLTGIGSSDAPIIAGERGSVLQLWAEKAGLVPREEPDEETARLFEWGHRLEPVVADWYSDTTGRRLRRVNRMLRHPEVAWGFASLDRVTATRGEDRIVEVKTNRWGWTKGEPVPGAIQAQVQHQMWVTGYEVVDLAVLTGGSEPQVHEIVRDDEFIENLVWLETEFMGWVTNGTRPPMDGSETSRRTLGRLHPRNDGTMIQPDPETDAVFFDWLGSRANLAQVEDRVDTLANTIRALIGDADGIEGRVTWRRNADSVRTDWPSVAADYRRAIEAELDAVDRNDMSETMLPSRADLDTIEELHSRTVEGSRSLRPVWKGDVRPGLLASGAAADEGGTQ